MQRQGFPWSDVRSKYVPKGMSIEEIKEWRRGEAVAGRPSSYEDFCRAFGFCIACLGEGVTPNESGVGFKVVGLEGGLRLFERCPVCGGTGVAPTH
jgi:hypothetical protein